MKLKGIDRGKEFDFGKTSDNYAKYRDIYPLSMYEKLIELGIGKNGQKILDLGSGTAILPINLYHTGAVFTSTDISENQVKIGKETARDKGMSKISFRVCSAEETGFEDNSFDAVTAVQCFQYFDAEKAAREIFRVLKPEGLFCKIFMDWLPFEDEAIFEMESLVLKYNPSWSGGGFREFSYSFPKWAENRFELIKVLSYDVEISFSKDAWVRRILTCRGVGASLTEEKIREFEAEYRGLLEKRSEPLRLRHQIHIELYKALTSGTK
ncbi:MAG: class I SAM-dependent methyltransferase [Ruminococcus sp.]|nr:class I SAM-dependent methyltransferase [Ruminococcus sp.]